MGLLKERPCEDRDAPRMLASLIYLLEKQCKIHFGKSVGNTWPSGLAPSVGSSVGATDAQLAAKAQVRIWKNS